MALKKITSIIAATSALLCSFSVLAAAPGQPDAGQVIRDLQQQLELKPKATTPVPAPRIEGETTPPPTTVTPDANARVAVKAVHVTGITVFPADELESVVAYLVGGEHTLTELKEGAARITAFYRERGYVVARAYLPLQEIKSGAVVINVQEGHIGKQIINNHSRISDQRATDFLSSAKTGDVLQAAPVDREIFLLNETPGVGQARAALQPGASVGTADILYELTPSAPYNANIEMDNYGNYYTGEYRLGAELILNSPLKTGDQLSLRGMHTNQKMSYEYVAYQVPVGGSGLRLGATYFTSSYFLGKDFADLQAHGIAKNNSFFATYPFIRNLSSSLSGTLTYESKKLIDTSLDIFGFNDTTDKQIRLLDLGLNGRHQDTLGQAGITSFDLTLAKGKVKDDSLNAPLNGSFTRLSYNINRLQRISDDDSLSVMVSGQLANKKLNSSEKFSLGGPNGVRAYPAGEGSGDHGWLANIELRHSFTTTLQGMVFYDRGAVDNRYPLFSGERDRRIAGAGVGANVKLGDVQIKATYAFQTSGGQAESEPKTMNRKSRLWLQASWQF